MEKIIRPLSGVVLACLLSGCEINLTETEDSSVALGDPANAMPAKIESPSPISVGDPSQGEPLVDPEPIPQQPIAPTAPVVSVPDPIVNDPPQPAPVLNSAPVASAGLDLSLAFGKTAELSAAASYDADGDPLTFEWTIISGPSASVAQWSNPLMQNTQFQPSQKGNYLVRLLVSDGKAISTDDLLISVSDFELVVSWTSSGYTGTGYTVHLGETSNATYLAAVLPVNSAQWNPGAPEMYFDSEQVAKYTTSDQVCVRIQSFNSAGLSPLSPANCVRLN